MAAVGNPGPRAAVKAPDLAAGLLIVCAAVLVFRGATAYGFSQDDFAALGRAAGLLPRFVQPWRWLALQGFFDVMRPLADLHALPYHLASLAGHALAGVLVYRLILRFTGRPAAFAGAVFFATHPASFTAVYWVSTIGDLWALVFALLALEWAAARGRTRWLAPAAFALALLCKESVLLLPLAIVAWRLLDRRRDARPGSGGPVLDGALVAMLVLAVLYGVYFAIQNRLAVPAAGAEPYTIGVGAHLVANLATYLGWTANLWLPSVHGWSDAIDPSAFRWGAGLLLLWAGLAFVPALARRGWLHGAILYAVLIAPVVPLRHHTYHYYLYGALAGAAVAVAALVDAGAAWMAGGTDRDPLERRQRGAPMRPAGRAAAIGWALAALFALAFTVNGALLVRKIETQPFGRADLRAEPIVDRALIAARVRAGLDAAHLPAGVTLYFYSPDARALAAADSTRPTYWERNVQSALYGGLAVRLFAPAVRDVRFIVRPVVPDSAWIALYDVAGRTRIVNAADLARAAAAAP